MSLRSSRFICIAGSAYMGPNGDFILVILLTIYRILTYICLVLSNRLSIHDGGGILVTWSKVPHFDLSIYVFVYVYLCLHPCYRQKLRSGSYRLKDFCLIESVSVSNLSEETNSLLNKDKLSLKQWLIEREIKIWFLIY